MEDKIVLSESFLDHLPITIGINEFGKFVVKYSSENIKLLNFAEKIGVIRLLEIDYYKFERTITKMVENFLSIRPSVSYVEEFPYEQIVVEALHSERDHWIELAFNWMEALGVYNFSDDILAIITNKRISQRIRHKIVKLGNK